jgi:O-antigen ligase
MTKVRWLATLSLFAVLTVITFTVMSPFHHAILNALLIGAPLILVFVVFPAAKILFRESAKLAHSFTWWQGLWLIMFLSGLVFRVRDEHDIQQSALDGWAVYRILLDAIVGVVLIERLLRGKTQWVRSLFRGLIGVMAIYPLLCAVSTSWSVAPGFTFFRAVEYLLDLSLLACIAATLDSVEEYEKFANWTWTLLGLLVVSAWIGAIVDPADALVQSFSYGPLSIRLEGVCPGIDANSIGEFCAILASIALCRILDDPKRKYDRALYRLLFAAALVTLIFTQTRAAVAAFLFSIILLFIFTRRFVLGAILGITASLAGVILVVFTHFGETVTNYLLRGQSVSEAETMSGRAQFWQFAMQKISERPWIGYGGYAGGRFVVLPGLGLPGKTDVLNTLVESLLDIGVWGPLTLVTVLGVVFWYLARSTRDTSLEPAERHLGMEILLAASIVSMRCLVSGNITSHPALGFLTCLGCAEFLRRRMKSLHSSSPMWSPASCFIESEVT